MWSVISKIFTKNSNGDGGGDVAAEGAPSDMDDTRQAKQRASMKWLLSKAFNNNVPENLKEPFYRDHENQERLKPQIVRALANAEIYCLALGNIYSDPNYHNLNHWAILQTLTRKGVFISEPSDSQITETTLIQTNPLRMSAHMAVIESIMTLYAKEVVTADRVLGAVQRFSYERQPAPPPPESPEQGALLWVSHACVALRAKTLQVTENGGGGGQGDRTRPPDIPPVGRLNNLTDGAALAALICYYCPDELSLNEIRVSHVPNLQDSLYNVRLVQDFCSRCLPASIFHLQPEDVTYMQDSMKSNVLVFLADLFNVIEIHPAKCVRYPGMEKFNVTRSPSNHLPVRKSASEMSEDSLRRGSEDSFVVHRGKNIPTLRTMAMTSPPPPTPAQEERDPLLPGRVKVNKERQNNDSKADERGEVAAGKPTNYDEQRKNTFAGRRSRRNSTSDDSQLTIENFGGSQDNLNFIGRNPDKEVGAHVGRKISAPSMPTENPAVRSTLQDARGSFQLGYGDDDDENPQHNLQSNMVGAHVGRKLSAPSMPTENPAIRSTLQDARGSFQLGYGDDDDDEKRDDGSEKQNNVKMRRRPSGDDLALKDILSNNKENLKDVVENEIANRMSFAEVNKQKQGGGGIQLVYMQQDGEGGARKTNGTAPAAAPNTTTWQQQGANLNQHGTAAGAGGGDGGGQNPVTTAQLNDVRLKLEEKRRLIESEKRRMEVALSKQREKVGKAAFLQAVTKEIHEDVEKRWLDDSSQPFIETRRTPDLENMDVDQYQHSIAQMNSSLSDIHTDIQRLASQQSQMQAVQQQNIIAQQQKQIEALKQQQQQYAMQFYQPLQTSASAPHIQPQFFLHDQSTPSPTPVAPQRRTWAQQAVATPPLDGWNKNPAGFVLHETNDYRYNNGGGSDGSLHHSNSYGGTSHSTPSASPQHRSVHRQISQLLDETKRSPVSLQQMEPSRVTHAPIPAPSADDMEPQNISFIGNPDDRILSEGLSRLNITSGTRTYRIPSPTRPLITRNSFQPSSSSPPERAEPADPPANQQKGFYIQFDDDQPKRPKPPLRTRRGSPKKERSYVEEDEPDSRERGTSDRMRQLEEELERERRKMEEEGRRKQTMVEVERERLRAKREASQESQKVAAASTLIIEDNGAPDPDLAERMKKRILQASLQRRQEQEEAKAIKEAEAQAWREREKAKEEEKQRKKEEQAARRAAILEQYKLKKAMEEAEREGKTFDRDGMGSMKPAPKMRPKASQRPRPKTIHIDSGSVELAEGMMQPSRGKKGSTSNLTANSNLKRDYYRGSQDSLADRSMLYRDSPDDSRGMSPCHSANQTLGRRGSYKTSTSRGSSTDQDSLAYRYGDTDSGLGRATPPRRAPSPGMGGSMRHLPSPSGPGSLPGLMSRGRRMFDDGCSDISSTPSMMDYTGPRLYKQPATKSNRGIMLNAVEYCVFPGVVNREAKRRVLEEINRSESKHFLILFRDAGCQFRALYSYCPDREEISKLYGTGPKQVNDRMFDKFFKYNSGGKCFSQVHTKHLTVTIDAFTIHNSLWQGKKVNLPNKKDMALVI